MFAFVYTSLSGKKSIICNGAKYNSAVDFV